MNACRKAVPDGAGGGEPCGEPVLSPNLRVCYDHAKVCLSSGCEQPRNPWEVFCPACREAALGSGDEVQPNHNES